MNPRSIGRALLVLGSILLLCYIAWIFFRIVKQPDIVAQNGLLPNPFTESLPVRLPSVSSNIIETITPDIVEKTPTEIPTSPEKKLFILIRENVAAYRLFTDTKVISVENPITGKTETVNNFIPRIRYAGSNDGFITDVSLIESKILSTPLSRTFIDGLQSMSFGLTGYIGAYKPAGSDKLNYFIKSSENIEAPKIIAKQCPVLLSTSIKSGASGRDIEYIQSLISRSIDYTSWTVGDYDAAMQRGIRLYQTAKKIPSTGILDNATVALLNKDCISLLPDEPDTTTKNPVQKISLLPGTIYRAFATSTDSAIIVKNTGSNNTALVKSFITGTEKTLLNLPFVDWNIVDTATGIYWTTRASATFAGSVFVSNYTNNAFIPVLTELPGLSVLPNHSGNTLLYSTTENNTPTLWLYTIKTKSKIQISLNTFSEKCVWNKSDTVIYCLVPTELTEAQYPDDWYKRGLSLTDTLYSIDPISGSTQKLDTNDEFGIQKMDIIRPNITDDNAFLFFQDWNSHYIWGYKLK
jgi:peptidoglycan hydrolase-like protein with peptidoglycan-binding domain